MKMKLAWLTRMPCNSLNVFQPKWWLCHLLTRAHMKLSVICLMHLLRKTHGDLMTVSNTWGHCILVSCLSTSFLNCDFYSCVIVYWNHLRRSKYVLYMPAAWMCFGIQYILSYIILIIKDSILIAENLIKFHVILNFALEFWYCYSSDYYL